MNGVKGEIPSITNLDTNAALNAKITEVKGETPSITNLTTTDAVTAVETKIPDVKDLAKKAYYDAKISEMEKKYFTTSDYNKFTKGTIDPKVTENRLVIECVWLKRKKDKWRIKNISNKVRIKSRTRWNIKIHTYDLSLFICQSYFFSIKMYYTYTKEKKTK